MKGSRYIDIALIIFMGYFAYNRFAEGHTGFGIMFTVLALLNILSFVVKTKYANTQQNEQKVK